MKPTDVAKEYIRLKQDQQGFAKKYIDDFTGDLAEFLQLFNCFKITITNIVVLMECMYLNSLSYSISFELNVVIPTVL